MALCIVFGLSLVSLSASLEWGKVQLGESVTLRCDISFYHETAWVRHKPDQIPVILLVAGPNRPDGSINSKNHVSPRFTAVANKSSEINDLRISNVTLEDLALFYCMGRVEGKQTFGRGTRLYLALAEGDNGTLTTKAPFETEDHHSNLYLLFSGIRAIGLLVFLSAVLTVNIQTKKEITNQARAKKYSRTG
ncbi:Ig kappa chain V19-17-like [Clupea harengus]|uniref:Ig kappa chain V19-17-like n=1 Tax=Clupea harengus TaxID=7950 RepID=A0A6P8FM87_CLUHA|nr:Ig kappa chain V19-17-like [Clupea harengus]